MASKKFKLNSPKGKTVWSSIDGHAFTYGGEVEIELGGTPVKLKPLEDQGIMEKLYNLGVPYIVKISGEEAVKKNSKQNK